MLKLGRCFQPNHVARFIETHVKSVSKIGATQFFHTTSTRYTETKLTRSYLQGRTDVPLLGTTIGQLFDKTAEKFPDREAAVFYTDKVRRTFAEIKKEIDQLAASFVAIGLKRGDRIGIWSPSCLEWILTQYASAKAGLVLVNVNPAYQVRELEYALKKVGVKALIAADKFKTQDYYEMLFQINSELISCKEGELKSHRLPKLTHVIMIGDKQPGTYSFKELMDAGGSNDHKVIEDLQYKIQFDDPVNIQFTSGTTGNPKGATLSHHNLVNNSYFSGLTLGYDKEVARICDPVPLYHCFGMVVGGMQMAVNGSTLIYPNRSFDGNSTLHAAQDENVTVLINRACMLPGASNGYMVSMHSLLGLAGMTISQSTPLLDKLVRMKHRTSHEEKFMKRLLNVLERSQLTRICISVPLYHCFGTVIGSLQSIVHGASLIFPSPGFDPYKALACAQDEKCTSMYGTPTMFIDMLNHPEFDKFDLTSLRTGVMAGSPCPIEIMKQVIDRMHMPDVTIAYGTTENSPVTYQSLPNDTIERRVTTIGRPHPHVEVKVVNQDGEIVPVGEKGELLTRGYMVMLNYWNDTEKTAEVIGPDRWYKTGDLAIMDEDGYGYIVGRIKDMVIRGGENLYPLEIEQLLYEHPKIEDVQVIGVPDERLGEELCAWVKLHEGESAKEQEIKDFCKGKLAHFKIPRYILFVKEFPLTVTGKIQKYKMREASMRLLDLEHVHPHF